MDEGQLKFTFSKKERINSKKEIKELFTNGSSFYLHPFKVIFMPIENVGEDSSQMPLNKILVAVPKRNFKKAVTRNKIKRRIKEAYRLNKHLVLKPNYMGLPMHIAYIYVGKEVHSFDFIQDKLIASLNRLRE